MKKILFALLLLLFLPCYVLAAGTCTETGVDSGVWEPATCSYDDVYQCTQEAGWSAGEKIVIPAGSATWSSALTITDSITLEGQTSGCPDACDDGTKLTSGGSNRLIDVSVSTDKTIDISGFTLDADGYDRVMYVGNTSEDTPLSNLRIHHNEIENTIATAILLENLVFCLIDHNKFTSNYGDVKILGDNANSWTLYPALVNLGSVNYVYIEDNVSTGFNHLAVSSGEGARWIFRYNSIDGSSTATGDSFFDIHGDTQNRGCVAVEIYENVFPNASARRGIDFRGGTGIIYNNDWGSSSVYGGRTNIREEHDGCTYDPPGCDGSSGGDEVNNSYIWNVTQTSTGNDIDVVEADVYEHIEEDTSWWDDNDNGSDNFTHDVAASKPGTCSDDDCYWCTDTKQLYRCDGANNWTLIYTPYTYPHPLAVEASSIFSSGIISGGEIH